MKAKPWVVSVLLSFLVSVVFLVPGATLAEAKAKKTDATKSEGKKMMTIKTEYGPIEIELFPEDAPKTVARIEELVKEKFYDGKTFHRVVPGFVVQGGDPKGNGTGGTGKKLKAEFNKRKHVEGTLAMARAADPDSADCQFYICLESGPGISHLDGQYTVFGQVVKGMEHVKKIKVGDKMSSVEIH